MQVDPARDAVCMYLAGQASRYPELDLQGLTIPPGVVRDARDEALAHQIADSAVTRWITLSYLCQQFLKTQWGGMQPELKGALLCGAAQLTLLDRVPAYAAVDHAVGWARGALKAGASKVVNAVLRRIAELVIEGDETPYADGRDELPLSNGLARRLRKPVFPDHPVERLAMATGHPRTLVEAWVGRHGFDEARALALHSLALPPTVLNTAHATMPVPTECVPHAQPGHHVWTGSRLGLVTVLSARQDIWVQDAASSRAVAWAKTSGGERTPRLIIDLCAGQGTKTRQLAAAFPDAQIVATDPDPRRFEALRAVFAAHTRVRVEPTVFVHETMRAKADLVLLDVPCSNSGVFARRAEAKYRLSTRYLASLVELQKRILNQGRALCAQSGALLYSTCSLEPMENDEQVAWACKQFSARASGPGVLLPGGGPGMPDAKYHDGAFCALLS